jgi:hypothetical protein
MLTTGWACSSGSPDDLWVSNRQLTRHRAGYSVLGADHGAAKVEQTPLESVQRQGMRHKNYRSHAIRRRLSAC